MQDSSKTAIILGMSAKTADVLGWRAETAMADGVRRMAEAERC